jgi:putative ABC transport system substrate-binding protein
MRLCLRRREFIAGLGGAAAWPLAAPAQRPEMPVVGLLSPGSPEVLADAIAAFRNGLTESGFIEGRNVTIDYRFAGNVADRLRELAVDLVRRRVTVITTTSLDAALAAKEATPTIPIVFSTGGDPVQYGLIASLSRPGGNVTGINYMSGDLGPKRLQLLHDLLPAASRFAALVDPTYPTAESQIAEVVAAASSLRLPIEVVTARTSREIDAAFVSLVQKRIDALWVDVPTLFFIRALQVATLATYHRVPSIYGYRRYVELGGLMSYGPDLPDQSRLAGIYVGRILKGEKPSDLPVMRPTKFQFVINMQTARIFGIEVPPTLLAIADEVIE